MTGSADSTVDIDALVRGDGVAWDAFIDRFSPVVYAAVWRTFGSHTSHADTADVDDVVQQVLCSLVERDYHLIRSYKPERASLVTYLDVIARTRTLQVLRRKRVPTVPLEDDHRETPADTPEAPESLSIPHDTLPPRQRLVLHLMYEEEMDVPEIAAYLDIAAQTVRSLKHEALKKLRRFAGADHGNLMRGNE